MTDRTGADALRRFLDYEEAEGAGGDDVPVYDVVGYDLTYGDLREVLAEHKAMADLLDLIGQWGIRFKGTTQDFDYPMACEQDAREALAEADGERWTLIHRKIGAWKETDDA